MGKDLDPNVLLMHGQYGNKKMAVFVDSPLFNDTLNTFYLWLYGIRHPVKDHSDSERGNTLLPTHELLISISSKGSFICTIPQTWYHIPQPHTTAFGTPVVEHWLERQSD